jgi:hypothetical protein
MKYGRMYKINIESKIAQNMGTVHKEQNRTEKDLRREEDQGKRMLKISVAEPEPHLLIGAGAVTQCGFGSDGSGSDNGIKHGLELKNDTKCNSF